MTAPAELWTRPAVAADVTAVTALQARVDTAWFGDAEQDEAEIAESFAQLSEPSRDSRLVFVGDRLIATALRWRTDAALAVDPDADPRPVYELLLPWLVDIDAPQVQALDRDEQFIAALTAHGWQYRHSAFDLVRPVSPGWTRPDPRWPDGVRVQDYRELDDAAIHRLVYLDARFADTPGHEPRDLDEWRQVFVTGRSAADAPVLAWRGDRLIGAAIGRMFSDGTGWINQVAVAHDEQGHGVGRALILETFRRRVAAGATSLGLAVMASNRAALRLYLDLGLHVDREWQSWSPGSTTASG